MPSIIISVACHSGCPDQCNKTSKRNKVNIEKEETKLCSFSNMNVYLKKIIESSEIPLEAIR